jgi:hypothetical protein
VGIAARAGPGIVQAGRGRERTTSDRQLGRVEA